MRQLLPQRGTALQHQQQELGNITTKTKKARAQVALPTSTNKDAYMDKKLQLEEFCFGTCEILKQTFIIEALDCLEHRCNHQPTHNQS